MFKNVGAKNFSPLHFSFLFFAPNCMIKYLPYRIKTNICADSMRRNIVNGYTVA